MQGDGPAVTHMEPGDLADRGCRVVDQRGRGLPAQREGNKVCMYDNQVLVDRSCVNF